LHWPGRIRITLVGITDTEGEPTLASIEAATNAAFFASASPVMVVRISIEPVNACHQNRSSSGEQLDVGIVDTLVSILL
jgi:hypothetical protein